MRRWLGADSASTDIIDRQVVAMKSVATGKFGRFASGPDTWGINRPHLSIEPHHRVFIAVDGGCASSCEEFLLFARQGWTVKLIGENSAGSLDYSNLRPWTLPSGRGRIWYAIFRSERIPGVRVDAGGIIPEFPLTGISRIDASRLLEICSDLLGAPR